MTRESIVPVPCPSCRRRAGQRQRHRVVQCGQALISSDFNARHHEALGCSGCFSDLGHALYSPVMAFGATVYIRSMARGEVEQLSGFGGINSANLAR